MEMTEAKALFKSQRLNANIKLTLYKALIRSVMIYACSAWELAADTYLLKLQHLQNKVLRTIGNFSRCTPVRDLHTAFNIPYVYDYITELCRRQAEVIQNHENEHYAVQAKMKPDIEKMRGLNLSVVKPTAVQMTKLLL
jgi:hypothetical protein